MVEEILAQVKALGNHLGRIKNVLKGRDALPVSPAANALVELEKLTAKADKVVSTFLSAIDEPPLLPGMAGDDDDAA